MKRITKCLTAILTGALLISSCSTVFAAKDETKLVVLGDSIATGFGLEGYVHGDNRSAKASFANMLADEYSLEPGSTYCNLAVDGQTTGGLLTSFTDAEKAPDLKAALSGASTVVISIGGNDFLLPLMQQLATTIIASKDELLKAGIKIDVSSKEALVKSIGAALKSDAAGIITSKCADALAKDIDKFSSIATNASKNISKILSAVRKNAGNANVYILTIYNPFDGIKGYEDMSTLSGTMISAMNDGIIATVLPLSTPNYVVDIASLFDGNAATLTNILNADIHPNKDGHKVMYDVLSDAILTHPEASETSAASENTKEETVVSEAKPPVETVGSEAELPIEAITSEAELPIETVTPETEPPVETLPAINTADGLEIETAPTEAATNDGTLPENGNTNTNTADKTSPEAGIEGVGVVIGVGLLGLLGIAITRKK